MHLFRVGNVADEPEISCEMKDESAVNHRISQTRVAEMVPDEQIERLRLNPSFGFYGRKTAPCKRAFGNGLVLAVDA